MYITTILYDGWTLCRSPLSSPALHLFDILSNLPDGIAAHVAVPQAAPDWLPGNAVIHRIETQDSARGRLGWEQRTLPGLARRLGAGLHLTSPTAPLFGTGRVFVSPGASSPAGGSAGFGSRLRGAFGRGGTARADLVWPEDIPAPLETPEPARLSPAVDPRFHPHNRFNPPQIEGAPELPAGYFLVHTRPDREAIRRALEAWTWASGPIGEVYPLLFLGLPEDLQEHARALGRQHHLRAETMVFYPAVRPDELHLLYQAASAVFLPDPAGPWHSPLRLGLACGVPVVAQETAVSDAIAGPAAYLVPGGDPRGTGSALIAVIIKDELRKQLRDAAQERVKSWSLQRFKEGLAEIYLKK
ncbi:MAG TPA: glycosyltransferase [Anaerolineales bacterium]|nr:glycosyltransferase [Anaerolineales bacterium]